MSIIFYQYINISDFTWDLLTLKVPIMTAADDSLKYFFIVFFQRGFT